MSYFVLHKCHVFLALIVLSIIYSIIMTLFLLFRLLLLPFPESGPRLPPESGPRPPLESNRPSKRKTVAPLGSSHPKKQSSGPQSQGSSTRMLGNIFFCFQIIHFLISFLRKLHFFYKSNILVIRLVTECIRCKGFQDEIA